MQQVIAGYFDDAHRGLHGQRNEPKIGISHVQLPPLHNSPMDDFGVKGGSDSGGMGQLRQSNSLSALDHAQVSHGMQAEKLSQATQEISRLSRKLRQVQDQLAVTQAKKDAFRAQATRLEKEFKKGRETSDALQKELLEAKNDAQMSSKEANDAISMMTDMRKAHIQEVRLLQRGLAARGNDAQFRNKVNEVADLVDKLGRAVVQRDEAIRDKTKMQVVMNKANSDMRALAEERQRLRKTNADLNSRLKDALRRVQIAVSDPIPGPGLEDGDSDEEFEAELVAFEKRQAILKDSAAGSDVLAEHLEKDKKILKQKLKSELENVKSLEASVDHWVGECSEKDRQLQDLKQVNEKLMSQMALLEEQISQKRREIAGDVDEERDRLEKKLADAEAERDEAQAAADGMTKVSDRLSQELVKIHEVYDDANARKAKLAAEVKGAAGDEGEKKADDADGPKPSLLSKQEQRVKTGEMMQLEVYSILDTIEYRAREVPDGEESRIQLDKDLLKELDAEDPWTDLFSRTGFSQGPPRRIIVASKIGEREVSLAPSGTKVILTIYRYDKCRFFVSGMEPTSATFVEIMIMEDVISSDLEGQIAACGGNDAMFDLLSSRLTLEGTDGDAKLAFNSA